MDASDDPVPVLPRHFEDGTRVPADVRAECAAAIEEALTRPLPPPRRPLGVSAQ